MNKLVYTAVGTQGTAPTAERGLAAGHLQVGNTGILFDCGEGTQRQLQFCRGLRPAFNPQVDIICITHWHMDHWWGLIPLLDTWALHGRTRPLKIFSPRETAEGLNLPKGLGYEVTWKHTSPSHYEDDVLLTTSSFTLTALPTHHRVTSRGYLVTTPPTNGNLDAEALTAAGLPPGPAYGLLKRGTPVALPDGRVLDPKDFLGLPQPGKRFVYTGDHDLTGASRLFTRACRNADLLVHDTTFSQVDVLRARDTMHSTAYETGRWAAAQNVRTLMLNHLSSRYSSSALLLREAASSITNGHGLQHVICPHDGQYFEF